jgi:hypothetical protein
MDTSKVVKTLRPRGIIVLTTQTHHIIAATNDDSPHHAPLLRRVNFAGGQKPKNRRSKVSTCMQGNHDDRNDFIPGTVLGYPGRDDSAQTCRVSNMNCLVA